MLGAMPQRSAFSCLVVAAALAAPGCFVTRAVGLGPDPVVPSDAPPEAIYAKGQQLFADQQWKDAGEAFGKLWRDFPKSDLASDAQFYEAESRYGQGKYAGAFELYKRYLKDWPLSPHAPLIQRRIYDIGTYTIEAGQHGFLGIFNYADEGVDELDYLVAAFPHGDLAARALFDMAAFEQNSHRTKDAINHLHDLVDGYPTSEWALEARLRLARAYREVNRGTRYDADALRRSAAEYRTYLERATSDPDRAREFAEQVATARSELAEVDDLLAQKHLEAADFYLRTGNPDAAAAELKSIVREHPTSRAAAEANRRLGVDSGADEKGTPQ
jgi:outer membrane assembly lipoprotein YfiO